MNHNKVILEKANSAIKKGDYEGFLAHCTDDTTWTFVGDTTLQGKEAVRQWMATAYVKPPQFTVETLVAEGELVAAIGKIDIADKNGEVVTHSYCDVWRFREGKMAELTAFVIKA